jgi:hypothetical protein
MKRIKQIKKIIFAHERSSIYQLLNPNIRLQNQRKTADISDQSSTLISDWTNTAELTTSVSAKPQL